MLVTITSGLEKRAPGGEGVGVGGNFEVFGSKLRVTSGRPGCVPRCVLVNIESPISIVRRGGVIICKRENGKCRVEVCAIPPLAR